MERAREIFNESLPNNISQNILNQNTHIYNP